MSTAPLPLSTPRKVVTEESRTVEGEEEEEEKEGEEEEEKEEEEEDRNSGRALQGIETGG